MKQLAGFRIERNGSLEKFYKPLPLARRLRLTRADDIIYRRDMREYRVVNNIPLKGVQLRKRIYPAVAFGVKLFRLSNKHTLEIVGDRRVPTVQPIIFAVTHIGKFDIERVFEACRTSCWIFNSDPETVYYNFDGFSLSFSGVIHIDVNSKTDRRVALETSIKLLRGGGNLMLFPEGIWNVEPSLPVLPLHPGIAKIAIETNADIVPVAIEQYGGHFQVNFGRNILTDAYCGRIKTAEKRLVYQMLMRRLRDDMATLKWEIFEKNRGERVQIGDFDTVQAQRMHDKLYEWTDKNKKPFFTEEILKQRQYRPDGQTTYKEAFAHLATLEPNLNNAFLLNKRNHK